MKLYIITGEPSGDKLASTVISKLQSINSEIKYLSVGGSNLKKLGIGSIFISHNLYHVHEVSDRIVGMARGEKVCDMNKDETTVNDLIKLIG